jgi:hypothetical protein
LVYTLAIVWTQYAVLKDANFVYISNFRQSKTGLYVLKKPP